MEKIFDLIFNTLIGIFNTINSIGFQIADGYYVYLGWVFVVFSIFSMVVSVFWKGANR